MSQSDLARALGAKPQQIQRCEATDYLGASLAKLIEVSPILRVRVSGGVQERDDRVTGVVSIGARGGSGGRESIPAASSHFNPSG